MPTAVTVRGLKKSYGPVDAVRGVSLNICDGDIFGLLGPNGAGKTTLLECIVGLRVPDAGEITVAGIDATTRARDVQQRIGVMLQSTALQDKITPREALQLFATFYRNAADPAQLLERFSLTDKANATFDTLSGGQRQRLALAIAFVNRPEILFLDEPTAGLDPQSRRELRDEIARLKKDGRTVLLTTHDVDEAERLCDRVAIMDGGEIIATGEPRTLAAESASMQSVSLSTKPHIEANALTRIPGVVDVVCDGSRVRFRTADPRRTVRELTAWLEASGIELIELHVHRATLEDVFLRLTGAEQDR
ncbi:MAG TPA: ABC transporter ATP-binding protein [Vicinamibacterales bacterium]|nr:ABC transporter ATP-binding protein [Vicinamibacterales bacterium]